MKVTRLSQRDAPTMLNSDVKVIVWLACAQRSVEVGLLDVAADSTLCVRVKFCSADTCAM